MSMRHILRGLSIGVALVVLPGAAFAQSAPSMMVERTPNYTLVLNIEPADTMMMGGHMDHVRKLGEVTQDRRVAMSAWPAENPWPLQPPVRSAAE